jgi:hypothetical protein
MTPLLPTNESKIRLSQRAQDRRALIRPVSQVTLRLKSVAGQDRYTTTIDNILRWLNNRAGRKLPDAAWQRKSFELSEIGAQHTAAISLAAATYWTARLDDADKELPLRTWVTEIGVGVEDTGDVLFGTRLISATRGEDIPYDRSIPGFVKNILNSGPAELDGTILRNEPVLVNNETEVDWLLTLLVRPDRIADVVVFSLPEGSTDPQQVSASAWDILRMTQGAAHVVILTGPASYLLTDRVGRELSVFKQGIRTYRPRFKAWIDEPSNHPLTLPQRIATWAGTGGGSFEQWLANQLLANTVQGIDREDRLPAFNTIRQYAAEEERKKLIAAGGSEAELLTLFEQDNERLRNDLTEQKDQYDGLLATAEAERESALQDANAAKSQTFLLRNRIRALETQISSLVSHPQTPIPVSLENFETWCQEHMSGSVEIINRAFQGVRKSEYHDPELLYKALILLRDYYVPMRIEGGAERKNRYEHALSDLQMEESHTGEGAKFSPELYTVQYGGQRRLLDRHLKAGSSREPRFCFRLYFFWDDDSHIVVVGWMPSHLDNRST